MTNPVPGKPVKYNAAMVIIGNEILTGRTPDANLAWLATQLNARGIILKEARTVLDIESEIIKAVNDLRTEVDYVFTTGGIGPTHDDITALSVAQAFGVPLEESTEAIRLLEDHYREELNDARRKMGQIPQGATLIQNPVSAAPGFKIENVYVFAGIPKIMQAMFDSIADTLAGGAPLLSNTVTCQLAESQIAENLEALQSKFPDIDMGSYPHFRGGVMGLSVVLRGTDEPLLEGEDPIELNPHALDALRS